MCPAGELLMDHGKILNDNSSNAGTLHNGAGRNYYQDSLLEWSAALWWELHCVSSLLSAWQLNSLQAGPGLVISTARVSWDEPQTSARLLPPRCAQSLIMWRDAPGPRENAASTATRAPGNWFSLCCVMQPGVATGGVRGKICEE